MKLILIKKRLVLKNPKIVLKNKKKFGTVSIKVHTFEAIL